ncbi:MAG: hypothetical protein H7039_12605 [Bryobacteraceae bacterium]|nr:hypothetical protein [Bryobacteraceae bacterium]
MLAAPQDDWPQPLVQTGFAWHDDDDPIYGSDPELHTFIASGTPPILFTLGTGVSQRPGAFFERSLQAVKQLGQRALFLLGPDAARAKQLTGRSDQFFVAGYAPYANVFPYSAVVVHQGGIGTTAQALRAGRPMLVVPFGFDQPDNAERVRKLGTGLSLPIEKYVPETAATMLAELLENPAYSSKAASVSKQVKLEDGAEKAAAAIEQIAAANLQLG